MQAATPAHHKARRQHPHRSAHRQMPRSRLARGLTGLALAWLLGPAGAADTSPTQQLVRWSAEAGSPGQADRGQLFFTSRHGQQWSCASCHGNPPTRDGEHASTGKSIRPMAPAANPAAFTSTAKVDKWFRRNCKDVLSRECSAAEKADVLAYLISLKP